MDLLLVLYGLILVGGVVAVPMLLARRAGRVALAADPFSHGFVPKERLDIRLAGPDQELTEALAAVQRDHDWRPAARLLSATAQDRELRWQRVQTLAGAAAVELAQSPGQGAAWLRTWRVEAPEDAGAAQVHAAFLVQRALRSPADSPDVRMILEEARTVAAEAASLAPGDPVPYITELTAARGLGLSSDEFDALWAEVTARAPHHMGAHLAALPYYDDRESAGEFAGTAAAAAPEGSLPPALPLFAVFAHLPEANLVNSLYESEVVTRAIAGAQYAARTVPAGHPMLPHVRHLLIWFLVRAGRYAEAVEQVRSVDGYAGALPWSRSPDPAAAYAAFRAEAVAGWERNSTPGSVR